MAETIKVRKQKLDTQSFNNHIPIFRYYSNSSGDVTVKMANAILQYSYEYLGNAQKLVRTNLTEKCFLTLTQVSKLVLDIEHFCYTISFSGAAFRHGRKSIWSRWYR